MTYCRNVDHTKYIINQKDPEISPGLLFGLQILDSSRCIGPETKQKTNHEKNLMFKLTSSAPTGQLTDISQMCVESLS